MNILWTAAGCVAFALGLIGAVVPGLPTVAFMLLAAFCFARGSPRFHDWLIGHPRFGPPIVHWREHGAIARRAKLYAMAGIVATFAVSLILGLPGWALAVQGAALLAVSAFILTRPDGPIAARPQPAQPSSSSRNS